MSTWISPAATVKRRKWLSSLKRLSFMKSIETLVDDINEVLKPGVQHYLNADQLAETSVNIAAHFNDRLNEEAKPREFGKLWASDLGKACVRQLHYEFNAPGLKEPLPYHAKVKFLYGNIIEELILTLARAAGHEVIETQGRAGYSHSYGGVDWQVSGRIDAIIDGVLVDVKSCSTFSFGVYTHEGLDDDNDKFGYRGQLEFYRQTLKVDRAGFLFIDKQLGHIKFVELKDVYPVAARIADKIHALTDAYNSGTCPPRLPNYKEPDGKSGNTKLCTVCSYCAYKKHCVPEHRTFLYSNGPKFLVDVKVLPKVPEVL